MKRNLIGTLSLVTLSLLLSVNGAYAQSAIRANVAFAFNVGSAQLPRGNYTIRVNDMHDGVIIQNSTTFATVSSHGQREYLGDNSHKLVFQHLGNQYFLTEIWGAQGSVGMKLPAPKPETRLEIASEPSHSGKAVMIALK